MQGHWKKTSKQLLLAKLFQTCWGMLSTLPEEESDQHSPRRMSVGKSMVHGVINLMSLICLGFGALFQARLQRGQICRNTTEGNTVIGAWSSAQPNQERAGFYHFEGLSHLQEWNAGGQGQDPVRQHHEGFTVVAVVVGYRTEQSGATPGRAPDLQRRGIWSRRLKVSFQCVASTSREMKVETLGVVLFPKWLLPFFPAGTWTWKFTFVTQVLFLWNVFFWGGYKVGPVTSYEMRLWLKKTSETHLYLLCNHVLGAHLVCL